MSISVLFSEPKIPQNETAPSQGVSKRDFSALQRAENSSKRFTDRRALVECHFSALQRAENSSKPPQASPPVPRASISVLFSEPKIPQRSTGSRGRSPVCDFSALQRAENSSKRETIETLLKYIPFQCSSASRKFLKRSGCASPHASTTISVLFSEPKIPQTFNLKPTRRRSFISVLFSEPKIPQSGIV